MASFFGRIYRKPSARLSAFIFLCMTAQGVHATLSPNLPRGVKTVEIPVAGRKPEICVAPKHFVSGTYSNHDLVARRTFRIEVRAT